MYSDSRYHIHGGFPHSEICGSKDIDSSPQLIAVYRVLHRLSMPRHPLNALIRLIYTHINFLNVFTLIYILFKRTSLKKIKQDKLSSHRCNPQQWWRWSESNRRPHACKARALPTELHPQKIRNSATMSRWAKEDLNLRPHAYQARALTS